jgi:predicted nucleic acid-binding protein
VGVLLDSSVPIKAQRLRLDERGMLVRIKSIVGNAVLGTSTIVVTELLQGVAPGKHPEARAMRQLFFDEFLLDINVHPYSSEIALLAGRIGGEQMTFGRTIPTLDLMIGATALYLGFSLLTANVRHFSLIPGLHVLPF